MIVSYIDTIMEKLPNTLNAHRLHRGWSQAELAQHAGISRAAVSAIEINRLVPSVAAALALAKALDCSVEDLFGHKETDPSQDAAWAWSSARNTCRFWHAMIGGRTLRYPVETTAGGVVAHDGVFKEGIFRTRSRWAPEETLVLASCDPAAALLASEVNRLRGFRVI